MDSVLGFHEPFIYAINQWPKQYFWHFQSPGLPWWLQRNDIWRALLAVHKGTENSSPAVPSTALTLFPQFKSRLSKKERKKKAHCHHLAELLWKFSSLSLLRLVLFKQSLLCDHFEPNPHFSSVTDNAFRDPVSFEAAPSSQLSSWDAP